MEQKKITKIALDSLILDVNQNIEYYLKKLNEQKILLEIYTNQLTQLN